METFKKSHELKLKLQQMNLILVFYNNICFLFILIILLYHPYILLNNEIKSNCWSKLIQTSHMFGYDKGMTENITSQGILYFHNPAHSFPDIIWSMLLIPIVHT